MKNSIKNLIIAGALVAGIFGISNAQEAEAPTVSTVEVSGEFSTDVTFGDATAFTTPYTGIKISGDGWELSTNLLDGDVNVEEAKYSLIAKSVSSVKYLFLVLFLPLLLGSGAREPVITGSGGGLGIYFFIISYKIKVI